MILQIYNNRGKKYVRIVQSFRDPITKQPKTKVIQAFGSLDKLLINDPQSLERLQLQVDEMNLSSDERKQQEAHEVLTNFLNKKNTNIEVPEEGFPLKNYGVGIYEYIWDSLQLDQFFRYRQNKSSQLNFNIKDVVSLLTHSRLLYPGSKLKTYHKQSAFLNQPECELEHLYKSLKFLCDQKDNLEIYLNKQLSKQFNRSIAVAFYDVTTYYFESVNKDELKDFGYSKDNKVNQVQVVMGLLIDDKGIPISYELFPGNTNDFKTMVPIMEQLKKKYGIHKMIVTADRGLNSKKNLHFLKSMGYDYVMAFKIRSSSKELKNVVLDTDDYLYQGEDFKWKVCDFETTVRVNDKMESWTDNMVMTWSAKRAAKDRKDRERLIEKSKKLVESQSRLKAEMKKGGKKYVKMALTEDDSVTFNEQQVKMDEQFDGYYAILTSDDKLSAQQVIETYQGLWKIEESFRVLKSNLEARPIYVWTEKSIRGHFAICYLALVIERLLEYRLQEAGLNISTERIQEALRSANITLVRENGIDYYLKNEVTSDFSEILKALKLNAIPTYGKVKEIKKHIYT
jgi:transposase